MNPAARADAYGRHQTGRTPPPPLPAHVRASNYFLQTGSPELTARQARRLRHKLNRALRRPPTPAAAPVTGVDAVAAPAG